MLRAGGGWRSYWVKEGNTVSYPCVICNAELVEVDTTDTTSARPASWPICQR